MAKDLDSKVFTSKSVMRGEIMDDFWYTALIGRMQAFCNLLSVFSCKN